MMILPCLLFAQQESQLKGQWQHDNYGLVKIFIFYSDGTGFWECHCYEAAMSFKYTFDGKALKVTWEDESDMDFLGIYKTYDVISISDDLLVLGCNIYYDGSYTVFEYTPLE